MDQKKPAVPPPNEMTVPEEDATLLAIEALEARTVDPDPKPLNAPVTASVVPPPAPVPPKVVEPVVKPVTPAPVQPVKPTPPAAPKPAPVAPVAPPKTIAEVKPAQAPTIPPKPKKPATPSEKMAEELTHAPTTKGFQFFANQKPPRKPFIIVGIILILIAAGVAYYFTTV